MQFLKEKRLILDTLETDNWIERMQFFGSFRAKDSGGLRRRDSYLCTRMVDRGSQCYLLWRFSRFFCDLFCSFLIFFCCFFCRFKYAFLEFDDLLCVVCWAGFEVA